ncbi:hypothetical protein CFAM422_003659 [Trichoderma lentiforme]|uniref:Uncharacterized protein n=1 Tax=Trichoderma lentiforme TaxID=1567552 RepID=A0A9P5CH96_9HYPO|nr:hypothetical protein CFAM422_003659 [Trichoderma lentiforme]
MSEGIKVFYSVCNMHSTRSARAFILIRNNTEDMFFQQAASKLDRYDGRFSCASNRVMSALGK